MWLGLDVLTRIFGSTHYDFNSVTRIFGSTHYDFKSDQLVFEGPR